MTASNKPPDSERHISEFTAPTHAALYLRRAVSRRQIRSLLMCLGGMSYTMVSCWPRGQYSSQNGQDVVKIFCFQKCRVQGKDQGLAAACIRIRPVIGWAKWHPTIARGRDGHETPHGWQYCPYACPLRVGQPEPGGTGPHAA